MKPPTLDEFIADHEKKQWPNNAWVREPGFKELYVRMTKRFIDMEWREPVLDIASIEAKHPGRGAFTALIVRLRKEHPDLTIYVESVMNERFGFKLEDMGFKPVLHDCYVLWPETAIKISDKTC